MRKVIFAILLFVLFCPLTVVYSQNPEPSAKPVGGNASELIAIDKAASEMTQEKGLFLAYKYYLAEDAILLSPNQDLIVGKDNILKFIQETMPNSNTGWVPDGGEVAKSEEMGWTWGSTHPVIPDRENTQAMRLRYLIIWEKDNSGNWKIKAEMDNYGPLKEKEMD